MDRIQPMLFRLLIVAAIFSISCREETTRPGPQQVLESAQSALAKADFGDGFDTALATLVTLEEQTTNQAVRLEARLSRAQAVLNLWLATLLTDDQSLYETLQARLSVQLDGEVHHPRNFQIVAQTLLEDFRLVTREAKEGTPLHARAQALGAFAMGCQGILFRGKADYFEGRELVAAIPDLAYLDHIMAVRDLVAESLERTDTPAKNWQNIALTVFGRVCPKAAAKFITVACTADANTSQSEEFCYPDFDQIPQTRRDRVKGMLNALCVDEDGEDLTIRGLEALKAYYEPAVTALDGDLGIPQTLANAVRTLAKRRTDAYAAIGFLLK